MVANIDRIYRSRHCPVCDEYFSVDRRSCPTCGGRLIGTLVEEHREIRWSGGHPAADVIRAALGSDMDHRDPEILRRAEAIYRDMERNIQEKMADPHSHVFISYVGTTQQSSTASRPLFAQRVFIHGSIETIWLAASAGRQQSAEQSRRVSAP